MNLMKEIKWISFVSSRFSRVDRKGKSAVTSFLASLGICFGVITLIVVMSVMNGFQMSFIDAILEISSYHIRVEGATLEEMSQLINDESSKEKTVAKYIKNLTPFYEAQSLLVSEKGRQSAALVRAVPKDIFEKDSGFKKELKLVSGSFSLENEDSVVLGSELAYSLGAKVGNKVNFFALSGGNDIALLDKERNFTVTGIFRTGYSDINSGYCFISIDDGKRYFGDKANLLFGIKLNNSKDDMKVLNLIEKEFEKKSENAEATSSIRFEGWREYNRSFFNALKIEKNILMSLVCLIFIVVGINIFNGIRRIIFERKMEISIFSSFGGRNHAIQSIFIFQGLLIGLKGAVPGLIFGLLISHNMKIVFSMISRTIYAVQYAFCFLFNRDVLIFLKENPMFALYGSIPARVFTGEVAFITLFGILSALVASYVASRNVLKMQIAEVLRDE